MAAMKPYFLFLVVFAAVVCAKLNAPPLAVHLRQAFSKKELRDVRWLIQRVRADSLLFDDLLVNRTFGANAVSHLALFLHLHIDSISPKLRNRLLTLALQADALSGWNLTRGDGRLQARCIELIQYNGASLAAPVEWHGDGGTLMTMVVMMSPDDAYWGGEVELYANENLERYTHLQQADVLIWRGWTMHRILPVTSGRRDVLAVEWWRGADASVSEVPRMADSPKDLRLAITLNPGVPHLYRWLGAAVCELPPCAGGVHAQETAEAAYRRAVSLEPRDLKSTATLEAFRAAVRSNFRTNPN